MPAAVGDLRRVPNPLGGGGLMFTRAGVSHRFRIVCYAQVNGILNRRCNAVLLAFIDSDDLVWAANLGAMRWGEHVQVHGFMPRSKDFYQYRQYRYGEDRSRVDEGGFRLKEQQERDAARRVHWATA